MRYSNLEDKKNVETLNSTINVLTNAVINEADDIKTVVQRTKEVFSKMGILESDIRDFLITARDTMTEEEYNRLEQGVEQIYG